MKRHVQCETLPALESPRPVQPVLLAVSSPHVRRGQLTAGSGWRVQETVPFRALLLGFQLNPDEHRPHDWFSDPVPWVIAHLHTDPNRPARVLPPFDQAPTHEIQLTWSEGEVVLAAHATGNRWRSQTIHNPLPAPDAVAWWLTLEGSGAPPAVLRWEVVPARTFEIGRHRWSAGWPGRRDEA